MVKIRRKVPVNSAMSFADIGGAGAMSECCGLTTLRWGVELRLTIVFDKNL